MIAKVIVLVLLLIAMLICCYKTLDAIRNNELDFAVLLAIASSLFGFIFGILLGSILF